MNTQDNETNLNYSTETYNNALRCILNYCWYEGYAYTMRKRKKKIMDKRSYYGFAIMMCSYFSSEVDELRDEASNLRKEVAYLQKLVNRFRSEHNRRIRVSA